MLAARSLGDLLVAFVYILAEILLWGVSKKQSIVARSIGEIEYWAVALGVTELMWLNSLFVELGYLCVSTPIVWSDNLTAKSVAENQIWFFILE